MNTLVGIILAIIAGVCAGLQPVVNAGVSKIVGNLEAAMVSIGVSFFTLLIIILFWGNGDLTRIAMVPKYYLVGGLLGITIVITSLISVKMLGAAVAISIIITSQKIISMLSDHFGWFGSNTISIDIYRILGLLLMVFGVRLMMK